MLGPRKPKDLEVSQSRKDDSVTLFLNDLAVAFGLGCVEYGRLLLRHPLITLPLTAALFGAAYQIVGAGLHLEVLRASELAKVLPKLVRWLSGLPGALYFGALSGMTSLLIVAVLGVMQRQRRTKYQKIFWTIDLTNGLGDTPVLLKERRDGGRTRLDFDTKGIGLSEFQAKKERFEAVFGCFVESIRHAGRQSRVSVVLSERSLPEQIGYTDLLTEKPLPPESFYAGMSAEGPVTQKIAELPHLLIAGATGAGKSVFFKQALLGLLESSPHLQMYLIDLKGGIEMVDFSASPNVAIVKDLGAAVQLLEALKGEMEDRFRLLEQRGLKQIIPARDKRDRIIVAVDEASVLYMSRPRNDPDYQAGLRARTLTDALAKLARAAAINLMLATQKLDRTVIPTSIQENVSGRMAFKANSLQGSMVVLGHKGALELPEIPGRGIWHFGTQNRVLQAAYVSPEEIQERCAAIAMEFEAGKRTTFAPLVQARQVQAAQENQAVITSIVKETQAYG